MTQAALEGAFRSASGRIVAALAARYRDLDLAEDAFADACLKAARIWPDIVPLDRAAWLYRTADRAAIDRLRRRRVREAIPFDPVSPPPSAEELLADDALIIPDERLRLILVCCHPAVAPDARPALTLRLVCGLSTVEIARAFPSRPWCATRKRGARARVDADGVMVPLSDQDPRRWDAALIASAEAYLKAAAALRPAGRYALEAAIHGAWCARRDLREPPPWRTVLRLYDALLTLRDDPVTRLNRAIALAEVEGTQIALADIDGRFPEPIADFAPYHAVRADLLRRVGRLTEANLAYGAALELAGGPAERRWLLRMMNSLPSL